MTATPGPRSRAARARLTLATLALVACGTKHPTAVVVAVSADPDIPSELSSLKISVTRDGVQKFSREYDLTTTNVVPGTLTLEGDDDDLTPLTVDVSGKGPGDATYRVSRRARLSLTAGRTKLLRTRLQFACFDVPCSEDRTCVDGVCVGVDVGALPDFVDDAHALAPEGCFDEARCLAGAQPVTATACKISTNVGPGAFNLAATWKVAPSHPVVVEPERYTLGAGEITLSSELCAASTRGDIVGFHITTACVTKASGVPVCEVLPGVAGAGGGGGRAGSAGAGGGGAGGGSGAAGGAGKSGSAGNAGSAGKSGSAGASGTGAGGNGGVAGVAGSGGMVAAGAGGTAGVAGAAGGGGTAGVSGGAGAGGAGAGGAGAGGAGAGGAGAGGAGAGGTVGNLPPATIGSPTWGACALHANQVHCWGYNGRFNGYLDGTQRVDTFYGKAAPVAGTVGATAVFGGARHVCAMVTGKLSCWGRPDEALGPGFDGTVKEVALPGTVLAGGAGEGNTCAWLDNREVWCWGTSSGDGTQQPNANPQKRLSSVDAFDGHSAMCATVGGALQCWGDGVLSPQPVAGAGAVLHVTSWQGNVFVLRDTGLTSSAPMGQTWATPTSYSLGGLTPAAIDKLSAGTYQLLALSGGKVYRLDGSSAIDLKIPGVVEDVSAGESYAYQPLACARNTVGETYCWGRNWVGELGDDKQDVALSAVAVWSGPAVSISASERTSTAIGTDGQVRVWGGTSVLAVAGGITPTVFATAGVNNTTVFPGALDSRAYLLKTDQTLELWTANGVQPPADGIGLLAPKFLQALPGAQFDIGVTTGKQVVVKLLADDALMLGNGPGLAGDTSTILSSVLEVSGRRGDYAGEGTFACARTATQVSCWGEGANGQLGNGSTLSSGTPVTVALPAGVTAVSGLSSGDAFSCAVDGSTGEIYCWGAGVEGQLGSGGVNASLPVKVAGAGAGFVGITAGFAHACAWKAASITCWGNNEWGELGIGKRSYVEPPTTWTLPGGVQVITVNAGRRHTCAIGSDDKVYCWGNSTFGQVGDGRLGVLDAPGVKVAWP